jgi:hypothetical protein
MAHDGVGAAYHHSPIWLRRWHGRDRCKKPGAPPVAGRAVQRHRLRATNLSNRLPSSALACSPPVLASWAIGWCRCELGRSRRSRCVNGGPPGPAGQNIIKNQRRRFLPVHMARHGSPHRRLTRTTNWLCHSPKVSNRRRGGRSQPREDATELAGGAPPPKPGDDGLDTGGLWEILRRGHGAPR